MAAPVFTAIFAVQHLDGVTDARGLEERRLQSQIPGLFLPPFFMEDIFHASGAPMAGCGTAPRNRQRALGLRPD